LRRQRATKVAAIRIRDTSASFFVICQSAAAPAVYNIVDLALAERILEMQNLHIQRGNWQNILDHISRPQNTCKVTIEVDAEDLGAQKEVENAELHGLSYDHKGGTIAIRAGAVEHMIVQPERIDIAHAGTDLICMEIADREKARHLITFVPPLHLPDLLPSISR
jgi:hypothetical protein